MNAKGKIRGHGGQLARYLMTGVDGEIAQLIETRGLNGFENPVTAFAAMQDIADANTNSTKPFFHGHIRLAPGEQLTDVQWMESLDRMEKRLGFEGQPRLASFHIDAATGEKHLHAAWFRVDLEEMRSIDPGLYKNKLVQLSRTLEREFSLRELSSERQPHDKARVAERDEYEESKRLGTDVREIRTAILDCLEHSDDGKSFKAALDERGFVLANGDRRDCFVVIDQEGGHHALNKKLTGQTLAQLRERFADLDRSQLPHVEQAQEIQHERQQQRQADRTADIDRQAEQAMQEAHAAAKGRTDDIRPIEPAAPIWDRDAETRAADETIIEAAIRAEIEKGRQPPQAEAEARAAEIESAPASAPAPAQNAPGFEQQLWESIDAGLGAGSRAATHGLAGLATAVEKVLSGFFSFFGGGEPKLTPQQQHDRAQAEGNEETLQTRAAQEAEANRDEQHWLIIEALKKAREREEAEAEQESARRRKQDRGYELERDW